MTELQLIIGALKRVGDRYSHGGATERTIGKALMEVAQEISDAELSQAETSHALRG